MPHRNTELRLNSISKSAEIDGNPPSKERIVQYLGGNDT